jgi:hypothetical protein
MKEVESLTPPTTVYAPANRNILVYAHVLILLDYVTDI